MQLIDTGLRGLDLMVEVLAHNERHPELWEQESWVAIMTEDAAVLTCIPGEAPAAVDGWVQVSQMVELVQLAGHACATGGCIAGHAVLMAGIDPQFRVRQDPALRVGQWSWDGTDPYVKVAGGLVSLAHKAKQLFGLGSTHAEAHDLGCDGYCFLDGADCDLWENRPADLFGSDVGRDQAIALAAALYNLDSGDLEQRVLDRVKEMITEAERVKVGPNQLVLPGVDGAQG